MQHKNDDWEPELRPRSIRFVENSKKELDDLKSSLDRGNEIFQGILDFLKDAAHKGVSIEYGFYLAQARIPGSNQRVTCQYKLDNRTVYIYFIFIDDEEE